MASHTSCPPTNVYSSTTGDPLHPSLMGHIPMPAPAAHPYPGTMTGVPGALYGHPGPGQIYPSHTQTAVSEAAAQRHMAAISADYQAASLQTAPPHGRYYTNHVMAAHPYGAIHAGYDMATFRRKATARETTSALKAWLREHRDNPYPTKGDKIMLAMISRMTLTQVSTWFANARRRLKKDKTTAINDSLSDTEDDKPDREATCSSRVPNHYGELSNPTSDVPPQPRHDDVTPPARPVKKCVQRLFSPDTRTDIAIDNSSSPESNSGTEIISPSTQTNYNLSDTRIARTQLPPISTVTSRGDPPTQNFTNSTAGSQKSKIWSINEIIGTKPATSDNESDDVNVSRESDSYYSEESTSFISQTDVYPHLPWNTLHTGTDAAYL